MLKIEINCKPGIHSVQVGGDLENVVFELCMAINAIHTQIKRSNEVAAASFKSAIMVTCGKGDSPVWCQDAPGGGITIVVPDNKEKGDA